jgi:hypothetical protein
MIAKGHRGSDPEQRRLDRVAITAAVTMLYGNAARVRSIVPVPNDREYAWVRLARSRPVFDRVKK